MSGEEGRAQGERGSENPPALAVATIATPERAMAVTFILRERDWKDEGNGGPKYSDIWSQL